MAPLFYNSLCLFCEDQESGLGQLFCEKCEAYYDYLVRQITVYEEINNPWSIWHNCTSELHEEEIARYKAELKDMVELASNNIEKHKRFRAEINARQRERKKAEAGPGGRPPDLITDWAFEQIRRGRPLNEVRQGWIRSRKVMRLPSSPKLFDRFLKRRLKVAEDDRDKT